MPFTIPSTLLGPSANAEPKKGTVRTADTTRSYGAAGEPAADLAVHADLNAVVNRIAGQDEMSASPQDVDASYSTQAETDELKNLIVNQMGTSALAHGNIGSQTVLGLLQ